VQKEKSKAKREDQRGAPVQRRKKEQRVGEKVRRRRSKCSWVSERGGRRRREIE